MSQTCSITSRAFPYTSLHFHTVPYLFMGFRTFPQNSRQVNTCPYMSCMCQCVAATSLAMQTNMHANGQTLQPRRCGRTTPHGNNLETTRKYRMPTSPVRGTPYNMHPRLCNLLDAHSSKPPHTLTRKHHNLGHGVYTCRAHVCAQENTNTPSAHRFARTRTQRKHEKNTYIK